MSICIDCHWSGNANDISRSELADSATTIRQLTALYRAFREYTAHLSPRAVYKAPIPALPFASQELRKISDLKRRNDVIGISRAWNQKSSEWDPVYIVKRFTVQGELFNIYTFQDYELGYAETALNADLSASFPGQDKTSTAHSIYLKTIDTREDEQQENYKYTGYLLMKAAVEEYRDRMDEVIRLIAIASSHCFYHKLGFRAIDSEVDRAIAEVNFDSKMYRQRPNTFHLGSVSMYLPEEARGQWREQLPLLKPRDVADSL